MTAMASRLTGFCEAFQIAWPTASTSPTVSLRLMIASNAFLSAGVSDWIKPLISVRLALTCSGLVSTRVPVQRPQVRISQRSMVSCSKRPYRFMKNPLPIFGPRAAAP